MTDQPRVAIVCDWLTGIGGAEKVVLELHRMFPQAPIYTSQYDPSRIDWFKDADVRTGWLQKLPPNLKKFLPPLRALYFSRLKLDAYDLIISSSGAEAKFVKARGTTKHLAYIHAPTHYYWSRYHEYMRDPGFGRFNFFARLGLRILAGPMRKWDYRAAQRPTQLVANSTHIQAAIKKYYGRDSTVVFPPIDVDYYKENSMPPHKRRGFVVVGRQTPYKRIDLAVAACTQLGLELIVIGDGPQHKKLRELAGPTISFVANASTQEIGQMVGSAQAFIFPGLEDFGMAPVEALATGTPVIAYNGGGALDYVGQTTGMFFEQQTVEALVAALKTFDPAKYSAQDIMAAAQQFSVRRFDNELTKTVQNVLQ